MKRVRRILLAGALCLGSGVAINLQVTVDVMFLVPAGQAQLFDNR